MPPSQRRQPKRVLVFTDSRGEYKRSFPSRQIFTEKTKALLESRGFRVDMYLCPFKWTSTLDFIELLEEKTLDAAKYDKVILYTGVVEWSPRNLSNFNDCIRGTLKGKISLNRLARREGAKRIVNDKLRFFRRFFGRAHYDEYMHTTFSTRYRNEPTKNLLSLPMLKSHVIPYLMRPPLGEKLIFINANRIVPGWNGNYLSVNPDGRPKNIRVIEKYARVMGREIADTIDLMEWSDDQVKRYTVDNMHLTYAGSEWIFRRLRERLT